MLNMFGAKKAGISKSGISKSGIKKTGNTKSESGKAGISVLVRKDYAGAYQGFTSIGHAGYAERGKDIICAAVSILVFTAVNSLEELAGEKVEVVQNRKEGLLDCRFPEGIHEKGTLLMDAMLLGLQDIEKTYGKRYIEIQFEEV